MHKLANILNFRQVNSKRLRECWLTWSWDGSEHWSWKVDHLDHPVSLKTDLHFKTSTTETLVRIGLASQARPFMFHSTDRFQYQRCEPEGVCLATLT